MTTSRIGRQSIVVASGLLVLGVATYTFLALAGRALGPVAFSSIAALWALAAGVGGGLAATVEQEVTRAVAASNVIDARMRPLLVRIAGLVLGLAAAAALVIALAGPALSGSLFGGDDGLVRALLVVVVGMVLLAAVRGLLAGTQRFGRYAATLAGEGVLRLLLWAGLSGTAALAAAAEAIAFTPILMVVLAGVLVGGVTGSRYARVGLRSLTANLGLLLVASLMAQGVANAGALVVALIPGGDAGLAGRFLAAFVVIRVPLFFAVAVQSTTLPALVASLQAADFGAFRGVVRVVGLRVGLIGVAFVLLVAFSGDAGLELLYGPGFRVGRVVMVLLAVSSVFFLFVAVLQAALLALERHAVIAALWIVGAVVFAACCVVPVPVLLRVAIAYLVTSLVVAGTSLSVIVVEMRGRRRVAVSRPA